MDIYFELLQYPVFSANVLNEFYASTRTTRQALAQLVKTGRVARIRNNLYTCISGETLSPVADRFQIASAITETSYVSHHTALEYHGITNQVYYEVYVASATKFSPFSFDGYTYQYVPAKFLEGVSTPAFGGEIRVSDIERTVVDCIKSVDKIGGIEELMDNLGSIKNLQEDKLLNYLSLYQNKFLYQKTGYFLETLNDHFQLSKNFFQACREKMGSSKRYLTAEQSQGIYDASWHIVVPKAFMKGVGTIDDSI